MVFLHTVMHQYINYTQVLLACKCVAYMQIVLVQNGLTAINHFMTARLHELLNI